jgi:hypothetical protein
MPAAMRREPVANPLYVSLDFVSNAPMLRRLTVHEACQG